MEIMPLGSVKRTTGLSFEGDMVLGMEWISIRYTPHAEENRRSFSE
jgi:hypothetical protein